MSDSLRQPISIRVSEADLQMIDALGAAMYTHADLGMTPHRSVVILEACRREWRRLKETMGERQQLASGQLVLPPAPPRIPESHPGGDRARPHQDH